MASREETKKRLGGAKSIKQMTGAMELVAATKMRRAQEVALGSRYYALTALEILANIEESVREGDSRAKLNISLLRKRPLQKTLIVVIAADKGLAGAFNSSVFKKLEKFLAAHENRSCTFVAVGQKAAEYVRRRGWTLETQFTKYGDIIYYSGIEPLAQFILEGYRGRRWDEALVFSTHFFTALRQEVLMEQLLPIDVVKIRKTVEEVIPVQGRYADFRETTINSRPARPLEYLIEPSPLKALATLLPLLFKIQVYHLILEANASEHSARRMAMKNATDNAGELIDDLTLEYNRSRQAAITKEISEITSTAAALHRT